MEVTRTCTIAIGTTQEAGKKANSIIYSVYEGYISCLAVAWCLVVPHAKHVFVLLPFVMPRIRHTKMGLHIEVSLKGKTTCILFPLVVFCLCYDNGMCWVQTVLGYNYYYIMP